ncbi:MAG TPA: hypothetical protein DDZ51_22710 [Planctomycetaceae bacterium]|nr:hypothetical protein [Planctomycetaceae bacterium]
MTQSPQKVTCPHCWLEFDPANALFIATHPELIGDEVLGEHHYKRLARIDVMIRESGVTDSYGFPIRDRACPRCRLQVPRGVLRKGPLFVSIAGAPSSGKTYYLTSLVHTLRKQLPQEFNLLLEYATSDEVERIEKLVSRLFHSQPEDPVYLDKTLESGGSVNNVINLGGQPVELPKPFLFSIRPTPSHLDFQKLHSRLHQTLALYDCSGEHFQYGRHRNTSNRSFGHFAKSNAVLFVYDPLQDTPALSRLASLSKDPQLHSQKHVSQQEKTLEAVVHQLRILKHLTPEARIKAPLLVVVQKYDVWCQLLPNWAQLGATSIVKFPSEGSSGVNVEQLNRSSLHIRKFLFDISPMFVSQAEANFETVRYFAVSALGTSPLAMNMDVSDEYESKTETRLCIRPRDIQPFRVTDPILWLLAKWKLIRLAESTIKDRKSVPRATVIEGSDESFHVVLPDSGQRITLDNQYAESFISDPYTGAEVWIPRRGVQSERPRGFSGLLSGLSRLLRRDN